MKEPVPKRDEMYQETIDAIKNLGRSATNQEISDEVAQIMNLSDGQLEEIQSENNPMSKFNYNLAWTKTYLKKAGILEQSGRGVWQLTEAGKDLDSINKAHIKKALRATGPGEQSSRKPSKVADRDSPWQEELMKAIIQLSPSGFERLCQYILRESGFIEVKVLGRTGDGGIDGKGNMLLSGLLKFQCFFQCKRYQGSVGAKDIRDFRGAMAGRSDKGLFITTGRFTKPAKEEASRDGTTPIDLVNGEMLLEKMKDLKLGLHHKLTVDWSWFDKFKDDR